MLAGCNFDRCWLLTTTTYGTWLPGDKRGFVSNVRGPDRSSVRHNRPTQDYDRNMPNLKSFMVQKLRGSRIVFSLRHAELLAAQLRKTSEHRGWGLLAVAVMAAHVHLVTGVQNDPEPEDLLRDYKSYGSRALNRVFGKPGNGTWWTESGSKRKLPTVEAVLGAVRYVMQQECPLLIWTANIPNWAFKKADSLKHLASGGREPPVGIETQQISPFNNRLTPVARLRNPPMPDTELLENLRWKKFPVLNDGFVCLVDAMGNDGAVVQAARVSYGAGTKKVSDDRTLIRYLLRHRHTTPFEMAEIKLLVRVPMDCWRQWIRHRSASVNEYSTRYSVAIDSMQTTEAADWRSQAVSNRQGSGDHLPPDIGGQLTASEREFQAAAEKLYQDRLASGVAREQARKDLPLSSYTEAYWKIDLHNLLHFLALRMDSHAQWEIREYASTIGRQIVQPLFPVVWEAFEDYRLGASSLSRLETSVIQRLTSWGASQNQAPPYPEAAFLEIQDPTWRELTRSRERDECRNKLIELGLLRSEA